MMKNVALSLALLLASGADGFVGSGSVSPSLKLACRTSATRRVLPAGTRISAERLLHRASSHDFQSSRVEEGQREQVGAGMGFLAAALLSCACLTDRKFDT